MFHGALSEKELDSLEEDLSVYESLNITESDWNEFGRFLYTLRKSGLTVPYPDAIISYVAIKNDVPVWTKDKHFKLIQAAEDKLKLYDYSE